ncbi:YicC/YloC family endoribonuclease [Dethiothermospora halolimnae]|uniref:YicC/YloC family endoribonuclease n=1 Tax=Dethiothermospora halolimnae TaxID=3114390 RepID=UPI003CCBD465
MIRSMTGFGRGENRDDKRQFTVEIKSLNHRYNDIIVRMPKHLNYLEEKIKKLVKSKIKRGRIEIYINLDYIGEGSVDVKVDLPLAKAYRESLEALSNELKIMDHISMELISTFPDILKVEKSEEDEEKVWTCLKLSIEEALEKMIEMRVSEGKELSQDIKTRGAEIQKIIKDIEARSTKVIEEYKDKLTNRIDELLDDKYEIDEGRLANEVAIFADKSNINEELVRLYSHINQLNKILESEGSVGRKLDFLVQEMNREANTIGAKSSDVSITNCVVDIKSELEKIREQVQNIE